MVSKQLNLGVDKVVNIFSVFTEIVRGTCRCGFERFNMRLVTDHRGYFLDLSIVGLFDRHLPILYSPSECHIWGDNPGDIQKYILAFFDYIEHNLLQKALQLQHTCHFNPKSAEKLDKLITAEMLAAKQKCRIFYQLPWDRETHEVMMSKNIIKTLFMGMRRKIDMTAVLNLKMKKLKEPFDLPTIYDNCNALLKILLCRERDLTKSRHANQATNHEAHEQAFVAMHTKNLEVPKKPDKFSNKKKKPLR